MRYKCFAYDLHFSKYSSEDNTQMSTLQISEKKKVKHEISRREGQ